MDAFADAVRALLLAAMDADPGKRGPRDGDVECRKEERERRRRCPTLGVAVRVVVLAIVAYAIWCGAIRVAEIVMGDR